MKKLLILLSLSVILSSCAKQDTPKQTQPTQTGNTTQQEKTVEKTKITTSILPVASIVKTIGWENVEVKNIVGAGQSPHGFELKSSHIVDLETASWVIVIGLDHIDGFLDKKLDTNKTLRLSEGMELLEMAAHDHDEHEEHHDDHHDEADEDKDEHHHDHEHEHHGEHEHEEHHDDHHDEADEDHDEHEHDEHEHGEHEQDPHIWNSPKNAKAIAKKITDYLSKIDTKNKATFEKNYSDFVANIDSNLSDFQKETSSKQQQYFIVFHDAHNYLLKDLGIDTNKKLVFRKSVLNEPNSNDMKELIDEIKEHNVTVAFIEPQFKSSNFEKLAKQYGITTYILDPHGTDETASWYIDNTKQNLESLKKIFK